MFKCLVILKKKIVLNLGSSFQKLLIYTFENNFMKSFFYILNKKNITVIILVKWQLIPDLMPGMVFGDW